MTTIACPTTHQFNFTLLHLTCALSSLQSGVFVPDAALSEVGTVDTWRTYPLLRGHRFGLTGDW